MNEREYLLNKQFKFLRHLKKMKDRELRRFHDSKFIGTKYAVRIPKWMHRSIVERRLFYYYCLKHYHYERDHPVAIEFRRKAKHVLSADYVKDTSLQEDTKRQLKEGLTFTATHIKAMPIIQVDRYLAGLSLFVEGSESLRRKVLWEWFNRPSADLIETFNEKGKKVRRRRAGNLNNKFRLRDLILEHPSLGYDDFMLAFGEQMPTVTRASFNNSRNQLKKYGYDIQPLRWGPGGPVLVRGPNGTLQRGRILNDVALIPEKKDGKEEPF